MITAVAMFVFSISDGGDLFFAPTLRLRRRFDLLFGYYNADSGFRESAVYRRRKLSVGDYGVKSRFRAESVGKIAVDFVAVHKHYHPTSFTYNVFF